MPGHLPAALSLLLALLVLVLQRCDMLGPAASSLARLFQGGWTWAPPAAATAGAAADIIISRVAAAHQLPKQQVQRAQQPILEHGVGQWPNCNTRPPVFHYDIGDPSALNRLVLLRQPTLVVGAPSDDWAAQNWTMSSLKSNLGHTVPNVILSRHPKLYYYNKAFPMFKNPPLRQRRWHEPYAVMNLSSGDFFRLVQSNQSVSQDTRATSSRDGAGVGADEQQTFAYFSSQIDKLPEVSSTLLAADLQPPFAYQSDWHASDGRKDGTSDWCGVAQQSLWVGSAGTVAHLHWDARYAVFAAVGPSAYRLEAAAARAVAELVVAHPMLLACRI